MFDVSVEFEKRLDKHHPDVLPPCHTFFTTVLVKLLLLGLLLSGLCQFNVLGVGGVAFSCSFSMSEPVKIIYQTQLLPVQEKLDVNEVK